MIRSVDMIKRLVNVSVNLVPSVYSIIPHSVHMLAHSVRTFGKHDIERSVNVTSIARSVNKTARSVKTFLPYC